MLATSQHYDRSAADQRAGRCGPKQETGGRRTEKTRRRIEDGESGAGDLTLGHQPVGLGPGSIHLGGHGRAEDGGEGADEILGDDLVVLGADDERGVLLGHALELVRQLADVDDVGGEGEDEGRQCAGLSAGVHVDAVEVVVELGVVAQHALVEDGRDVLAMLSQGWDGLVDQLGFPPGKHDGRAGGGWWFAARRTPVFLCLHA